MFYGGFIFNAVGASFRWLVGNIWRTIFQRKKYSFSEYLNGPNDTVDLDDTFYKLGSGLINRVVGALIILIICLTILKLGI